MKSSIILIAVLCFTLIAQDLRGGSGTDIDDYCVVFTSEVVDTCKALYGRWEQQIGWNKYKVTTIGNSLTFDTKHWQCFDGDITGISNAADLNAFKDSTFAQNHWCSYDSCKGVGNGAGATLRWDIRRWVCDGETVLLSRTKSMVAPVMIGTNDVNTTWDGGPRMIDYENMIDCLLADNVIPIVTTIVPINGDVWPHDFDPDSLLVPYNDSLRAMAERRKIPLLDLHQWCLDHGGPAQLNSDWTHSVGCGSNGAVFTDDCLDGGESGGVQNARNYLLLMAMYDIHRFVVKEEPLTEAENVSGEIDEICLNVSPNPFNPVAVIAIGYQHSAFSIKHSVVSPLVEIYNLNGALIEKLTAESRMLNATYSWNAASHPSGIYIVRVNVGNKVLQKRITLIK